MEQIEDEDDCDFLMGFLGHANSMEDYIEFMEHHQTMAGTQDGPRRVEQRPRKTEVIKRRK